MERLPFEVSGLHRTLVSFLVQKVFMSCVYLIIILIFLAAYVQDIYEAFMTATKEQLRGAEQKLKGMSPPPMNTMLDKQTKEDAIKKRLERSQIAIQDVPPTTPGTGTFKTTIR